MSNWVRLAIGFTAGVCATLLPRITAALAAGGKLVSFSPSFVWLAIAFSLIVGVVTMLTEWGEAASPREVFKAALLVPSLLSGMFNAADGAHTASQAVDREQATLSAAQGASGVPTVSPSTPTVVTPRTTSWDPGFQIRRAFDVQEPLFYVVLGPFESAAAADPYAGGLPIRMAVGRFYVIVAGPLPRGQALPIAIAEKERGRPAALLDATSVPPAGGA